jgi:DNA-binding NtrC family response regulator
MEADSCESLLALEPEPSGDAGGFAAATALPPGHPAAAAAVEPTMGACGGLFGDSIPMREVFRQIRRIAPMMLTVLIEGQSGTGKELAARALHQLSGRRGEFIAVNCGAMAHELVASTLFGHERGSFTGAASRHRGFFEQAEHGTLFLDEITEMPYALQAHLLRALESGVVRRVGGSCEQPIDCRIVAATNRDSHAAVCEGTLREDLFYRLTDFPLRLPPLRERPSDIFPLALRFLARLNESHATAYRFHPATEAELQAYGWPGNVRELKQRVQRAWILCEGEPVRIGLPQGDACAPAPGRTAVYFQVGMSFAEVEQQMLRKTLAYFHDDKPRAAQALGISLKTIYNRLARGGCVRDAADA